MEEKKIFTCLGKTCFLLFDDRNEMLQHFVTDHSQQEIDGVAAERVFHGKF
jgi:hypothetical protein